MFDSQFPKVSNIVLTALFALFCAGAAEAQETVNLSPNYQLSPTPNVYRHALATSNPRAREGMTKINASHLARAAGSSAASNGSTRYPGDLQYNGGSTVTTAMHHAIFVNPTSSCLPNSCWGDPIGFLRDLSSSNFIHVTDQYTGVQTSHRYPVGTNYIISYPVTTGTPLTDYDMEVIAYSAAAFSNQDGYGHIYHIFLVPGQDECFTSGFSVCYSPDNPTTFYYCAYHSSFDVSGFGHVLYTVEPFQDVGGCDSRPGTPNGQLTDSTNNILSHETFETITDPDGTAWWNVLDNGLYGQEIGDECSFITFTPTGVYFDPSLVSLNGKSYAAQPEYSNRGHGCKTKASTDD
ncbi:MAG: hypothetical protein WA830_15220 [Candidatus Sulfotelmatobacter sp.]